MTRALHASIDLKSGFVFFRVLLSYCADHEAFAVMAVRSEKRFSFAFLQKVPSQLSEHYAAGGVYSHSVGQEAQQYYT